MSEDIVWYNSIKQGIIMPAKRDTYKYNFKVGPKIVHTGVTNDLRRRESEHQQYRGWNKGHIKQVGYATTRDGALIWEREQARKGKPTER